MNIALLRMELIASANICELN